MKTRVFCGTAFHTPERGHVEILKDVSIVVDEGGSIARIASRGDQSVAEAEGAARASGRLFELPEGHVFLPGLVDLHIHAPQWPQLGKALDAPLEVWLQKYTFPLEAKYADVEFAREVYADLVATLLANGTTTAVYFATIHAAASLALVEICIEKGQRAFVGKVAMDSQDNCPGYYRDESAAAAIEATRDFIQKVRAMQDLTDPLVHPIVTPRFIPSCTDELLRGLGRLSVEHECRVQTHCSESDWESGFVRERYGASDAEALQKLGLLKQNTILAHSNFVTSSDLDLIKETGAGVAHCPLSNIYFANAVFPLRAALERGVHVGLGSDISGGHSPSILDACRYALAVARARQSGIDPSVPPETRGIANSTVGVADAFWSATAGGAAALGIKVGRFAEGYKFDALAIDAGSSSSNVRVFPGYDTEIDTFEKIVLNATRHDIRQVWVNGVSVV